MSRKDETDKHGDRLPVRDLHLTSPQSRHVITAAEAYHFSKLEYAPEFVAEFARIPTILDLRPNSCEFGYGFEISSGRSSRPFVDGRVQAVSSMAV